MSDEATNRALDRLTEETAEAIIFTLSAAIGDSKAAVMRLLH